MTYPAHFGNVIDLPDLSEDTLQNRGYGDVTPLFCASFFQSAAPEKLAAAEDLNLTRFIAGFQRN